MKVPILSAKQIERQTEEILDGYTQQTGKPVALPVPIEKVAHQVLDLAVEWAPLPALPGRRAISKLTQPRFGEPARILLNVDLLETIFRDCPGLEQTAIAHESGHGVFHLDHGRQFQLDLGLGAADDFISDETSLTTKLAVALGMRGPVGDDSWREWQAHTFMRHILMPRRLLLPLLEGGGYLRWSGPGGLYELREQCGVTISALVVHLTKLGYIFVDDRSQIHDLSPLARGQRAFSA